MQVLKLLHSIPIYLRDLSTSLSFMLHCWGKPCKRKLKTSFRIAINIAGLENLFIQVLVTVLSTMILSMAKHITKANKYLRVKVIQGLEDNYVTQYFGCWSMEIIWLHSLIRPSRSVMFCMSASILCMSGAIFLWSMLEHGAPLDPWSVSIYSLILRIDCLKSDVSPLGKFLQKSCYYVSSLMPAGRSCHGHCCCV